MTTSFDSPLGVIEFSNQVLRTFTRHQQNRPWSREAGGQLFFRKEYSKVLVTLATEPKRSDIRGRFSFWPNRHEEQRDIERLFRRGFHYIGDWHTHPEDLPAPSNEDIEKMEGIFAKSDHRLAGMLLVVVGRQLLPDGLWCGLISSAPPTRLAQLENVGTAATPETDHP